MYRTWFLWIVLLLAGVGYAQNDQNPYTWEDEPPIPEASAPVIACPSQDGGCFTMPAPNGCVVFAKDAITVVLEPKKTVPSTSSVAQIATGEDYRSLLQPTMLELLADRRPAKASEPVVIRIAFVNPDPGMKVEGLDKQPLDATLLTGGDPSKWNGTTPVFAGVAYRNLWPGIDLTFKVDARKVTCLMQTSEGADPGKVRMQLSGLTGMKTGDMGELQIETPAGSFTDDRPEVLQTRNGSPVALWGEFAKDGDYLKLGIRGIEGKGAVEARWSSGLLSSVSGGWTLTGSRRVFDLGGVRYVAGTAYLSGNKTDCFAARVDPSGKLGWISLLGGEGLDTADAVSADRNGAVFVSGYTRSEDFPTTKAAYLTKYNGSQDFFTARLNPSGKALEYSSYLGQSGGWLGAKPMAKPGKLLAIVVDDVKNNEEIEELANLGIPMTFALMSYCTPSTVDFVKSKGSVAFLHAPLEALGSLNRRTKEILVADSAKDKEATLEGWLAQFPGVVGMNNHRGSAGTSDPETMKVLLGVLKKRNLVFVDSHTAPVAVGANVGKGLGVPCEQQDIFLDARTVDGVKARLLAMAELAERTGYSMCICHVGQPAVPEALREMIPKLQAKGFKFVTAPDLFKALDKQP